MQRSQNSIGGQVNQGQQIIPVQNAPTMVQSPGNPAPTNTQPTGIPLMGYKHPALRAALHSLVQNQIQTRPPIPQQQQAIMHVSLAPNRQVLVGQPRLGQLPINQKVPLLLPPASVQQTTTVRRFPIVTRQPILPVLKNTVPIIVSKTNPVLQPNSPLQKVPSSCVSVPPTTIGSAPAKLTEDQNSARMCAEFLKQLMLKTAERSPEKFEMLRSSIQQLLDDDMSVDVFLGKLNHENTEKLSGAFKLALPIIRMALARGTLKMEGIKAPPSKNQIPVTPSVIAPTSLSLLPSSNSQVTVLQTPASSTPQFQPGVPNYQLTIPAMNTPVRLRPANSQNLVGLHQGTFSVLSTTTACAPQPDIKFGKRKYSEIDDINDVTVLAGVDLHEEADAAISSYRGKALMGRIKEEETFLNKMALVDRILSRLPKGVTQIGAGTLEQLSHASNDFIRSVMVVLSRVVRQRQRLFKKDENYVPDSNPRAQIKFMQELAATTGGPSKQSTKDSAMAQSTLDESNNAALQAIGPKRQRVGVGGQASGSTLKAQPRAMRVDMEDILHVMRGDKQLRNTPTFHRIRFTR